MVIFDYQNSIIMRQLLLLAITLTWFFTSFSQEFFNTDFNKNKKYIILTNPTVRNLKTIQYLNNARLLAVKTRRMKFAGVYYEGQNYDFGETKKYIEENNLENYFLQEINGDLNEDNLFENNDCSVQLKTVFDNSIGVFFFGGPDIPPGIYEEKNTLSLVTDPARHYFEATFLFHLLGSSRNVTIISFPFCKADPIT